jgi:hypothetical protein
MLPLRGHRQIVRRYRRATAAAGELWLTRIGCIFWYIAQDMAKISQSWLNYVRMLSRIWREELVRKLLRVITIYCT